MDIRESFSSDTFGKNLNQTLRVFGFAGILIFVWLALHQSKNPAVLGRYSFPYSLALSGTLLASLFLLILSHSSWRNQLYKRRAQTTDKNIALYGIIVSWFVLPACYFFLRNVIPVNDDRVLTINFISIFVLVFIGGLFWWYRLGEIHFNQRWLFLVFPIYLLILFPLIVSQHGKIPDYRLIDEIFVSGTAWKQAHDPLSLINISPDRNAQTWANFSMLWPLAGFYMKVFGAGWLQARAFFLIVLYLAGPFIYGLTSRLFGRTAAIFAVLLAFSIPLHHNWALSHGYVATATAIALYAFVRTKHFANHKYFWQFVCGFFALSAVEGHIYGLAFTFTIALVQLRQLYVNRRQRRRDANSLFITYLIGTASFLVLWCVYHIALADISLFDYPKIISQTYAWEDARGDRLSPFILWKSLELYAYINPYEMAIFIGSVLLAILRKQEEDLFLLFVLFVALLVISVVLAHINKYYFIFFMPFICILGGKAFAGKHRVRDKTHPEKSRSVSLLSIAVFVLILQLFIIQLFEVTNRQDSHVILTEQREKAAIGSEIDQLLPIEEIVIAGDSGYFTGMHHRLNYWSSFSFTWEVPDYWPLDPPQAIIVTLGGDDGYSGLADWLVENDFQAIECYSISKARNEAYAAILYTLPELNLAQTQESCTPELLGWLDTD